MVSDLLTPTGRWRGDETAIGVYPPVAVPGRPSTIIVHSKDREAKSAEVRLEGVPGGSEPLKVSGGGGWLTAQHTFDDDGEYQLHCDGASLDLRCRSQASAETRDLGLREDFLRDVAAAAGGTYVPVTHLADVLRETPGKTRESIASHTLRTVDAYMPLLILFLGLAAADFVIRKRLGMVL
jgi:hypothetical protein